MNDRLSETFGALADPTRRAILARLASGAASVTELASPFEMSMPAISKHLKVLERAGLIARGREAQWRPCRLQAGPLQDVAGWVDHYRRFWEDSFDRLDAYLRERKQKDSRNKRRRASMSAQNAKVNAAKANTMESSEWDLVMTRVFDAPRELVFKAWTETQHVAQWWGPKGFTNPVCELDVRAGGAIRIHMRAPDGVVYPMTGVFQEIVEPERLVFVSSALDESGKSMFDILNTVIFAELGGKTNLTLQARVIKTTELAPQYLKGMEAGWTQSLDRVRDYVETMKG